MSMSVGEFKEMMEEERKFESYLDREELSTAIEGLRPGSNESEIKEYFTEVLSETTIDKAEAKELIIEGIKNCTGWSEDIHLEIIEIVEKI